jgi:hypothetical protein
VPATTSGAPIIVTGPKRCQREAMRSNSASVRRVSPKTRSSSRVRGGGRVAPRCAQRSAVAEQEREQEVGDDADGEDLKQAAVARMHAHHRQRVAGDDDEPPAVGEQLRVGEALGS